jgi:hypothetical protein
MPLKQQSALEFIMTYSWAFIIMSLFVVSVVVLSGSRPPSTYLGSSCNIQPLLPCVESLLSYNSIGKLQYYVVFTNQLGLVLHFPANALNVSSESLGGFSGSSIGNCTPSFAGRGSTVLCTANIGNAKPSVGTQTMLTFEINYSLCNSNAKNSCQPGIYKTSGFSTQGVASSNTNLDNVTFITNPSTSTIMLNGVTYFNGISAYLPSGSYSLFAAPSAGLYFSAWSISSPTSTLSSTTTTNTTLTLKSNAVVTAVFAGTSTVSATTTSTTTSIGTVSSTSTTTSTSTSTTTSITSSCITSLPDCTNNWLGGACQGPIVYNTGTPTQITDTIGSGSPYISNGAGIILTGLITASSTGTLQSVGIDFASGGHGNAMVAIYSDNDGSVGTLLGESASVATTSGWENIAIPGGVTITAGTSYFLAEQFSSPADTWYYEGGYGGYYLFYSYGSFPSSASWNWNPNIIETRMIYTALVTTLTSDVKATGSITINPSITLNTGGYSILSGGTFTGTGAQITVPSMNNGGYGGCTNCYPTAGGSVLSSYGGSGGSGGYGAEGFGASGGSTLAAGGSGGEGAAGATPSSPSLSNSLIQTWYSGGMQNYLAGAGGGGGGATGNGNNGAGGAGSDGVYIQAPTIIAPAITTYGGIGGTCTALGGAGGGGGGGSIVFAYQTSYTPGMYNINGGNGASGCFYSPGGNGGSGQVTTFQYSVQPLPFC